MIRFSRRSVMKGIGAAGAVAASGGLAAPAIGQARTLTVSVWGGVTEEAIKAYVAPEFTRLTGAAVAYDIGGSGARYNKLLAQRANPTVDVFLSGDDAVIAGHKAGILASGNRKNLPNLADVAPWALRIKHGTDAEVIGAVPYAVLAYVLAYNPETVKTPPTSWGDMWKPEFSGKVAYASQVHSQMPALTIIAAELAGGSAENIDPGFKKLAELRPGKISVNWSEWSSVFKSGDVVLATEFNYYLETMKNLKYPIAYVVPKEKAIGSMQAMSLVKGSPHKEIGEAFLNLMIDPKIQAEFARRDYHGPVSMKVSLSDTEKARCTCGTNVEDQVRFFDPEMSAAVRPAWTERLNIEVLPKWKVR
jgi:putative spermidine/putrescine transport system substrate-binding protein